MDLNILLFIIGRIIFGGYFIINGLNHLTKLKMLADYAASQGLKSAKPAVIVSGLMILLGGLGILLGLAISWSVALITVFLLIVSFRMHPFWKISDPNQRLFEQINFMKNMALIGATLMILMISDWPVSYQGY